MKILYVEDEIAHVVLTQRTLEDNIQHEFTLLHAEMISDALRILDAEPDIDLILSDLRLPDGTGLDLLKKVRERSSPPAVVLVTGQGDQENAVAALKAGAADYLVKQSDYLHRLPIVISNAIAQNRYVREQAALREAEIKYQSLVEQIPAVVFLDKADESEATFYMSPRIKELTGYTPDEWYAIPDIWFKSIHPADQERINKAYEKSHENGIAFSEEYRFIRRDGRTIWIKEDTNLIRDGNRNPLYWQGILLDITQEKESQASIRESEERFRRIFHSSPIATCVVTLEDGRFIDANQAFLNLIGTSLESLIGNTSVELGYWDKGGDRESFVQKLKEQGTLQGIEIQYVNVPNGPKDTLAYYELIELGGKSCVLSMFYEVTEQKKAQKALQRQLEELSVLHTVATAGAESYSEDEMIERVTKITSKVYPEVCGILQLNDKGDTLSPHPSYLGADVSNWRSGYPISQGITGKAVLLGKTIRSGDISNDSEYIEIASDIRSELCVPIRVNERIIGVLNVESRTPNAFEESDERILNTIAGGLGTALEKLRLFKEEQQRRQEAETLRRAATAISSSLDPNTVAKEILTALKQIITFNSGSVFLHEGDKLRIAMVDGYHHSAELKDLTFPEDDEFFQMVKITRQPIIVEDAQKDARFKHWGESTSVRGWMVVPLISRGRVIGAITLDSLQPGTFDENVGYTAMAFAYQAAAAIENARLYDETQRRLNELETINRLSASLRMTQPIKEMLEILLNETLKIIQTEHGSIWLYDAALDKLAQRAERGEFVNSKTKTVRTGTSSIVSHVFLSGKTYISEEFVSDPLVNRDNLDITLAGLGGVCIPIQSTAGTIGVLMIGIKKGRQIDDQNGLLTTLAEIGGNAIHRAQLFEHNREQIRRLTTLRDIDSAIASSFDLRLTLNILMDQTIKHLNVNAIDIGLYHQELQSITYIGGSGFQSSSASRVQTRIGEGLAGQVIIKQKPFHLTDLQNSPEIKNEPLLKREGFVTYIGIPLIVKGQIKGVFEVFHRTPLLPTADWMEFLHTLAGQAAIAIDNSQLFENLQRSNQELIQAYDTTLEGWARALELRDRETEGHTRRVTDLTLRLAKYIGINDTEMINIHRGVLLHDIGKMGVPDQILKKSGPLNEGEWSEMRQHPVYAHNLLSPILFLRGALDIPYCHHEHWDGSGYPRGLKGEQIPHAARIFSVVDIWDALLSDRPYRKAWPQEEVTQYLKDIAGTLLDPTVVEVFLKMIAEEQSMTG
ncbi:MAG TPA: GAF domain-containing protein [Anaerolineales bacterium]|nr:GAF domain-containing protein [Anaerolineales bacterium]